MCWVSCFKWQSEKTKLHSITFIKYCLQWPNSYRCWEQRDNLITCSTSHKTSLPAVVNTATFHPLKNDWQPALLIALRLTDMLLVRLFQIITSNHMSWRRWVEIEGEPAEWEEKLSGAESGGQVTCREEAAGSYRAGGRKCPGGDLWSCAAVFSFASSGRGTCTSVRLQHL